MSKHQNEGGRFSLSTGDVTALASVTIGVILVTVLLVWILF
ncbi:MAG TPA: hypothetical protein VEW66_06260 [Thermomicrobiales bacterium]|nr:hypothetical protein [Thermomicrobiales bacterium]